MWIAFNEICKNMKKIIIHIFNVNDFNIIYYNLFNLELL